VLQSCCSGCRCCNSTCTQSVWCLNFVPPSHVRWLAESNGIEILQPASIKSYSPATKLLTALTNVSALSLEVWIQPATITQTKFAHICSFVQGWRAWDFVLAQTYADILFYVRTPLTGYDREVRHLRTDDSFLTTERMHLVATLKMGSNDCMSTAQSASM
jgi:hypothetical protein